jgi:hypothetical protein
LEEGRLQANKHRDLQLARTGGRRLFDDAAKAEFLEWFAATCNLSWSAELAGFNYKTVLRHLANDPRFAEGCERAVRLAYPRLEAKLLETRKQELPIGVEGDRDAPDLEIDPQIALTLLREHNRRMQGVKKPGRTPRVATNEEVREALAKRLVAFAERVRGRGGGADAPARDEPDTGSSFRHSREGGNPD